MYLCACLPVDMYTRMQIPTGDVCVYMCACLLVDIYIRMQKTTGAKSIRFCGAEDTGRSKLPDVGTRS